MTELSLAQKQKYEALIEQQDATIQTLKADIKKKTADLQVFVASLLFL